jgi:hypothetical protein
VEKKISVDNPLAVPVFRSFGRILGRAVAIM